MDLIAPQKSIEERIKANLAGLSPKHVRLARLALEDKAFFSYASANQAGQKTGASAATVVRFAQALGYRGFSDLQSAIRAELPHYLTAVERLQRRLAAPPPAREIPRLVFYNDIQNLERTVSNLSLEELDKALDDIIEADKILVVSSGISAAPSLYLTQSLNVIGFDARAVTTSEVSLVTDLAQIQENSVLIAIDLWRYSRSTMRALETARMSGARTIAITDSRVSQLAQKADYAFEVAAEGAAHSSSATALISLANAIVALMADKVPGQVMQSLQKVDDLYREHELLLAD
jgi:DNA-binding MurR/RpiR family transcriptional regulator